MSPLALSSPSPLLVNLAGLEDLDLEDIGDTGVGVVKSPLEVEAAGLLNKFVTNGLESPGGCGDELEATADGVETAVLLEDPDCLARGLLDRFLDSVGSRTWKEIKTN